jgi:hypothetical protein
MRYGIDAKLFDWLDEITAECPRKQAGRDRAQRRERRTDRNMVHVGWEVSEFETWKRKAGDERQAHVHHRDEIASHASRFLKIQCNL